MLLVVASWTSLLASWTGDVIAIVSVVNVPAPVFTYSLRCVHRATCSGKTSVVRRMSEALKHSVVIHQDHYYLVQSKRMISSPWILNLCHVQIKPSTTEYHDQDTMWGQSICRLAPISLLCLVKTWIWLVPGARKLAVQQPQYTSQVMIIVTIFMLTQSLSWPFSFLCWHCSYLMVHYIAANQRLDAGQCSWLCCWTVPSLVSRMTRMLQQWRMGNWHGTVSACSLHRIVPSFIDLSFPYSTN